MPSFSLYQKRGRYGAVAYDRNRTPKRKYISFGTRDKSAAMQALARMERDTAFDRFDPWQPDSIRDKGMVLSEAISAFLKDRSHCTPKTIRGYSDVLSLFDRSLPVAMQLRAVKPDHISSFLRGRQLSRASQASYFRTLRAFFNWASKAGAIEVNPIEGVAPPKDPKNPAPYFAVDDVRRLLVAIEEPWLKHIVRFAVCTGLRRGELINLRWRFVNLSSADAWMTVQGYGDFETKSGHGRSIPLVSEARLVLEERYDEGYAPDAFVFADDRGRRLSGGRVSKAFKRAVRLAGLDDRLHFHSLRHTCASWLVMHGQSLLFVAGVLGHSSTQVTQRYAHLAPDSMSNGMNQALGGISLGERTALPQGRNTSIESLEVLAER